MLVTEPPAPNAPLKGFDEISLARTDYERAGKTHSRALPRVFPGRRRLGP
jgi:hypothetical protein